MNPLGIPEPVGLLLFFAAVTLTAYKIVGDIGHRGYWGYVPLMALIGVYAGAVGLVWS